MGPGARRDLGPELRILFAMAAAGRHRRRGAAQHPAVAPTTTCSRSRGPGRRRRGAARAVRDGPDSGGHRPAAAAAVLGLRDPARRRRRAVRHLAADQARRPRHARLYDAAAGRPVSRASARSASRSRWSRRRRGVDGGRRRRPRAVRHAGRGRCGGGAHGALFYGGRTAGSSSTSTGSSARGVDSCWRPRTAAAGAHGRVTRAARRGARARAPAGRRSRSTPAGPSRCWGPWPDLARRARPPVAGVDRADHGLRPRRLLQLRRARARRRRRGALRAVVHRTARSSTATTSSGSDAWISASASARSTLTNPLIAASGCFGYGVEYADIVDLSIARRGRRQGPVPRRARRPSAAAHRRDAVGHAQRHRPAGHRRPPVRRARSCPSCGALGAIVIVNVCGTTIDEYVEVARILSDVEGVAAHRAEHLLPEHQGRRHPVRLQPGEHRSTS